MQEWLKDRKQYFGRLDTDALFVSQWKSRLSTDMVRRMITKYTDGVTTKRITPHKLRATCAVTIYDKTKDILVVKDILGHDNLATTQIYTRASEESKKKAVQIMDDLV